MRVASAVLMMGLLVGLVACEPRTVLPPDAGTPDAGSAVGGVEGLARLTGATSHEGCTVLLMGTSFQTTTATDGGFRLEEVPEGAYELVVSKEGYTRAREAVVVKGGETVSISLTLERATGSVAGHLQLAGADSHEGIAVSLEGTALSTTTTADGGFHLGAVPLGAYELVAWKEGYVKGRQAVVVKEGETVSVSLTLVRVTGSVTGHLELAGADSHEGIAVSLEGTALSTTTTADGGFHLGAVPPGAYELVAWKAGYVKGRQAVVVKKDETVTLSLSLARAVGRVTGYASVKSTTYDGLGIVVTLEGTNLKYVTSANGYFNFASVPTGTYVLSAQRVGYVTQRQTAVVEEGKITSIGFFLEPASGRVEGRVLRQGANSHEGSTVVIMNTGLSAKTAADGRFGLAVPIGTYDLEVRHEGYVTWRQTVEVKEGETVTLSVSLQRMIGRVAGRVSLNDVSTHEGIAISLEGAGLSTTTTTDGGFSFEGVPAGTYALSASKARYSVGRQSVKVVHGETSSVSLTLSKLPPPSFTVPMLAVQGGRVSLSGSDFGPERGASTVTVGGMPVEEYVLWSDSRVVVQLPFTISPGTRDVVLSLSDWGESSASVRVLPQVTLAGGAHWLVGIREDNTVVAFGSNASVPPGLTDVVSVAGGAYHALALKRDGTVVAWGEIDDFRDYGQATVPAGLSDVVFVTGGNSHSLALRQDGTFVGWGYSGVSTPMERVTDVVGISAGAMHSLVLKRDGGVFGWGYNLRGEASIPGGLTGAVGVAAGNGFSLVLKQDGTVVAWGDNSHGQTTVPPELTGVVAVAAGWSESAALKRDGTVVTWGGGASPGELSGVAAVVGADGVMALTQGGRIVWANTAVPPGLVLKVPAP